MNKYFYCGVGFTSFNALLPPTGSAPCITITSHTGEAFHCIAEIVQWLQPRGKMKGRK